MKINYQDLQKIIHRNYFTAVFSAIMAVLIISYLLNIIISIPFELLTTAITGAAFTAFFEHFKYANERHQEKMYEGFKKKHYENHLSRFTEKDKH